MSSNNKNLDKLNDYHTHMDSYFEKIKEIEAQIQRNNTVESNVTCNETYKVVDKTPDPVAPDLHTKSYRFGTPSFGAFIGQPTCYNRPNFYRTNEARKYKNENKKIIPIENPEECELQTFDLQDSVNYTKHGYIT